MKNLFNHTVHSLEETEIFAQRLSPHLKPGTVLALVGDLGAGKTTFVKALAKALQVIDTSLVTSPTFTLIQEYPRLQAAPLFHIDFYRLDKENQLDSLGLEEYFSGSGIVVVEWGDRFPSLFPPDTLWLTWKVVGEKERTIDARGSEIWRDLGREFGAA